jgi:primosomal replication protein N
VRNEVRLNGTVVAREPLRFTPAGIPILSLTLQHESTQVESGISRQVAFEIDAMAVGETAQRMDVLQAGSKVRLAGFLASRSKLSTRIVLHVNQFEPE